MSSRRFRWSHQIYRRGAFWLDWDERADGSRRSPFLAVFWYDAARRKVRSSSTGTEDVEEGKARLDAVFLEQSTGQAVCPTCHRPWDRHEGYLLTAAIADYLAGHAAGLPSEDAICDRLDHVLDYLEAKRLTATTCDQVDERWVKGFRAWSEKEPIVSPTGKERPRSLSTIEGHDRTDPVTSPYAPFQPTYLKRALAEIEAIIDEILTLVPSAFHRSCTGAGADVVALGGR